MNHCQFCKDPITDGREFVLHDKENDEFTYFCADCVGDMMHFFKSEKSEERKFGPPKGKIGMTGRDALCEIDDKNRIVKVFDNFMIQAMDIKPHQPQIWRMSIPMTGYGHSIDDIPPHFKSSYEVKIVGQIADPNVLYLDRPSSIV